MSARAVLGAAILMLYCVCTCVYTSSITSPFSGQTAYDSTILSSVAYSDNASACLDKAFPHHEFELVEAVGRKCDDLFFDYKECFAYTAVSKSRKTILLSYRGTSNTDQLIDEFVSTLFTHKVPSRIGGKVERYFAKANDALYPCVKESIQDLVSKHPDYHVLVTGHSLGGAVASIGSAYLLHDGVVPAGRLSLYTFGQPRVGDREYADSHDALHFGSWRVVHYKDIVSQLPPRTAVPNSPWHHSEEIYYPANGMTVNSTFVTCHGGEDSSCSRGSVSFAKCWWQIHTCIKAHQDYYNHQVSKYCDNLEGRPIRNASSVLQGSRMAHLFSNTECRRIKF